MARVISYNGVTFPYTTLTVNQAYEYDTDDRTLLGIRYTYNVTGWLTSTSVSSFEDALDTIRAIIYEPRKELKIYDGATTFYQHNNASDMGWGPKTESFTVQRFAAMLSCRYTWQVSVFVNESCIGPDTTGVPNTYEGVIGITRSYSFSVDDIGHNTRSISGSLKCADNAGPADKYRDIVCPALPLNFRRVLQQYSMSPDQRTLTFNIVDQEMHYVLPPTIGDGEATWTVRIADTGARIFYNLSGRFKAGRNVAKVEIINQLIRLINSRFPLSDRSLIFEDITIADSVYGNELTFNVTASGVVGSSPNGIPDLRSVFRGMTKSPPQFGGQAYLPGPYGSLNNVAATSKKHDPFDRCTFNGRVVETPIETRNLARREAGIVTPIVTADAVDQSGVSFEHLNTPFVAFQERISYELDNHVQRFDSKNLEVEPVFQQTARPRLLAIQSGYFQCYAESPDKVPNPPLPIWAEIGQVLRATIMPLNPEPFAAGNVNLYTVHWVYVIALTKAVGTQTPLNSVVNFPVDLRRPPTLATAKPWQQFNWPALLY